MNIQCTEDELKHLLAQATFTTHGDPEERRYANLVIASFPQCEEFWRWFVVPMTRRIEHSRNELGNDTQPRDGIDPQIEDIASIHYSMFMHLVYAHWHLQNKAPSRLENIYAHLSSACDLAEALIEKWYLLLLSCQNRKSKLLQELSREDFQELAGLWYDNRYAALYEHYYSKGRSYPIDVPKGENLLREYFGDTDAFGNYLRFSQNIRTFRNAVIHGVKLGIIVDLANVRRLVPKMNRIRAYRKWREIRAVAGNPEILERDFVEIDEQIKESIQGLEAHLNSLWEKLLTDFLAEFYSRDRSTLRKYYSIEFVDATKPDDLWKSQEQSPGEQRYITTSGNFSSSTDGSAIFPLSGDDATR